jgi:DNA primase
MARIPQEEIDRVKREVSVESLVRARGIQLKTHGENLLGLCPFHDDREPSLVVTPKKNLWHCMGACQTGGDVFAWVVKAEGTRSFRHAYELLSTGFYVPSRSEPAKRSEIRTLASPISLEMTDDEMLLRVMDYYVETAKRSPEIAGYLERRGLAPAILEQFHIGFANRTLGLRLPAKNRQEGAELRERLQKTGILRASSGHEHFNGSLVIPVFDSEGRIVEMYGRKITDGLRKGTPLHLYLPGPHRGVWNLDAVRQSKEIILCEALIDALTFWSNGYQNVTASYGVEGFTRDHLEVFKAFGTERVLIAYDRDDAGDRAAEKLAEKFNTEGIDCYRLELPRGMDVNEYACKVTPAAKSLGVVLRSAVWMGKGKPKMRVASDERRAASEIHVKQPPSLAAEPEKAAKEKNVEPAEASPLTARHSPLAALQSASPHLPELPPDVPVELVHEDVWVTLGDRKYRIRGLKKNTSYQTLKISVLARRDVTGAVHLDTFDLAISRQRLAYEKQAASELGVPEEVVHRDMGEILKVLEVLREREIEAALAPKEQMVKLTSEEHDEAMKLLKDPNVIERIVGDLEQCGLVGERTNKLTTYLAAVSRKLDDPLAIIIQSSSAAGKTTLMDAVLAMIPEEERVKYSAMTGKSLFYISEETSLRHKILAISEEEGAEQATYALKLLQSEGRLTIASTGKDPATGKLVTQEYHVEGPVMIILTTTAVEIDEELLNRCVVLTVDEDRNQTRAIHRLQREAQTLEGLVAKHHSDRVRKLHQNAQRLLRPIAVVNPYARHLTFLDSRTRTRRDHMKYLTLIRTIALLYQYQRPHQRHPLPGGETLEYIEVTRGDIALANELAHEVLGRSLDELAPQTRRLLEMLTKKISTECERMRIEPGELRFTNREVREWTGWTDFQVRTHLRKLVFLEYVLVHRGGRGQSFVYELLYRGEGEEGRPFMMGLADPAKIEARDQYDARNEHPKQDNEHRNEKNEPPTSIQRAPIEQGPGIAPIAANPHMDAGSDASHVETSLGALLGEDRPRVVSYKLDRGNGRDHNPPRDWRGRLTKGGR